MLTVTVVPDNGTAHSLKVTTRDILKWERETGKSFKDLENGASLADLYQLAWAAALRTGFYVGTLDQFEATHDIDFEAVVEEAPLARSGRKAR